MRNEIKGIWPTLQGGLIGRYTQNWIWGILGEAIRNYWSPGTIFSIQGTITSSNDWCTPVTVNKRIAQSLAKAPEGCKLEQELDSLYSHSLSVPLPDAVAHGGGAGLALCRRNSSSRSVLCSSVSSSTGPNFFSRTVRSLGQFKTRSNLKCLQHQGGDPNVRLCQDSRECSGLWPNGEHSLTTDV